MSMPRALILATAVGALLAGCGSGSDSSSAPPSNAAPAAEGGDNGSIGPTLQVMLNLTGAMTVRGSASTLAPFGAQGPPSSCADWAKGAPDVSGKPMLQLPGLISAPPMDGHQVLFTNQLDPYQGPGQYATNSLHGQGGGATVEIDGQAYALGPDSKADTEIRPDGSGQVVFSGFTNEQSGGVLNGTVSWTCTGS